MTLRRLTFIDAADDDAIDEVNPVTDSFAIAQIILNGLSGVGLDFQNVCTGKNVPTPTTSDQLANKGYVDSLAGPSTMVEVNLGSSGVSEGHFSISDSRITANSLLSLNLCGQAPTGKEADELEMDLLWYKALPQAGSFDLYVRGMEGNIAGTYRFLYRVG